MSNRGLQIRFSPWPPDDGASSDGDKYEREGVYECDDCGLHFSTNKELARHRANDH